MLISTKTRGLSIRNVLMIAYDFPPANTSGSWRPFHFAKHLPEFGFVPLLVTQSGFFRSCATRDGDVLKELEPRCRIRTIRPLGEGRTPTLRGDRVSEATPSDQDRSLLGRVFGRRGLGVLTVWAGLRFLQREGFDLIWATGPPWLALTMGYRLSLLTGRPLVADIRDPWTYGVLWTKLGDEDKQKQLQREQRVLRRARRTIYTSPLTAEIMRRRSDESVAQRILAITNGYAEDAGETRVPDSSDRCLFSYIGKIEKGIRDPSIMLEGFQRACRDKAFAQTALLRLIGDTGKYRQQLARVAADKHIESIGPVPYRQSLRAMRTADVLVLLQTIPGEGNDVIGGKAYEYLASRRPILGIVPRNGGDAWLLSSTRAGMVTGISDVQRVAQGFLDYWRLWKDGQLNEIVAREDVSQFSRRKLTGDLAAIFDDVLAQQ